MEEHVWSTCINSIINPTEEAVVEEEAGEGGSNPVSQQAVTSIRSLIINPYTSNSTVSSIVEALTRSLKLATHSLTRHHILKLLADLASHRPYFSSLIFHSIHPAVDSLPALSSISESNNALKLELDDQLFVSMCFGSSVPMRLWLLKHGEKFGVSVHVMLTVFLGFTKDPYPYVRKEALDGCVRLCKYGVFEDTGVIEGCYCRGVELLKDSEGCVRSAAVNLVCEWGLMLIVTTNQEESKRNWSATVFVQLCSMVRDMNMEVRVGAFDALGKVRMLSEEILWQTLSKKVLPIMKERKSFTLLHTSERFESLASSAAGAFVHGLEDEFYEVRRSACHSLRKLIILSAEFADRALNLLMDMLNDDSMVVRLEALETLHHMATNDCLNVQETHMHMFLGTLIDNNDQIRSAARKVYKLVKLPRLDLLGLSVEGLLKNLDMYPQDEADIFCVLFYMGQSHKDFTANIIKEVSQELEPVSDGNISLDSARVAAYLVLSISTPLSCDQNGQNIPRRFFSYAVTLLGRISFALKDIMDEDALFAYISQCSRAPISSEMEVGELESSLPAVDTNVATYTGMEGSYSVVMPLPQVENEHSKIQPMISVESGDVGTSYLECQLEEHDQIRKSMNIITAKVNDVWLLVQSNYMSAALKILRVCQEEMAMLTSALPEFAGGLALMSQYLKVIKLLAKIWGRVVWKIQSYEIGELEIILGKLERRLRAIRCRFVGFSKLEELHVLELVLVACILRLSKAEICCCHTNLKMLLTTMSHIDFLLKEESIEVSNFIVEVKKTLHEVGPSVGGVSCSPFAFMELVKCFSIKQFGFCARVRHLYAALDVPDNDSENPLPFLPGLPVAIHLAITLHNILSESRLWLRMAMHEDSMQFVFLDLNVRGGCYELKKFTFVAPFYKTPKASSFTLRVCIGMECMFEDVDSVKKCGGPKHPLVYICPETEVHLCSRV